MSSLYLLAIAKSRTIRSLRDVRYDHLPMLRSIRHECEQAAIKEYGILPGTLRFFVHYQPTYCRSLYPVPLKSGPVLFADSLHLGLTVLRPVPRPHREQPVPHLFG